MNKEDQKLTEQQVANTILADRNSFLSVTTKIAIALFGIYALSNFVSKDFPSAIMQAIMVILLVFSLMVQKRKMVWSINIATFVLAYITLYNFTTGGVAQTGVYWIFLFPGLVFTFQGKKNGLRWTIPVFIVLILAAIGSIFYGFPKSPYSTFVIINQLMILAILSGTSYFRQNIVEKGQDSFKALIKKINEDSNSLTKTLNRLEDRSQDLEKLNRFMIGRELKMIQLKEENKILESKKEQK
jgi:hypothetical protein